MDYRVFLAAPLAALVMSVGAAELRLPHDWELQKMALPANPLISRSADYEIGLDPRDAAAGQRSLTVRSVGALSADFTSVGAAQQLIHGYAGQRVRFSAEVRSEGARAWAGLFLGAGEANLLLTVASGQSGVEKRLPMGAATRAPDSDWQDVSVVVQLPDDTRSAVLGVALVGEGQVWARRLRFEVVGADVPLTRTPVGIDWARSREASARVDKLMSALPPGPLVNAALD
jgi:hypothetical protein